jgi:orotate phosphoribosyltransferase
LANIKKALAIARSFRGRMASQEEILEVFKACAASWVHDGDPSKPHAKLTSGKHSNGFFDCLRVLCYPHLAEAMAEQLVIRLSSVIDCSKVGWVIGSPMAGITFAHEVARLLGPEVIAAFVEKNPDNPDEMIWRRRAIPGDAYVLQVDELVTTAKTLNAVERAVRTGNPNPVNFLPVVGMLVHRPDKLVNSYGDRGVVTVIEKKIWAVRPDKGEPCALCEAGSAALKPKTHWEELTGTTDPVAARELKEVFAPPAVKKGSGLSDELRMMAGMPPANNEDVLDGAQLDTSARELKEAPLSPEEQQLVVA